jgi:hypothetical protein
VGPSMKVSILAALRLELWTLGVLVMAIVFMQWCR